MISWEKMINKGNPNTFTVPITVVTSGQSTIKHNTFMSVGHEMTMKQVYAYLRMPYYPHRYHSLSQFKLNGIEYSSLIS